MEIFVVKNKKDWLDQGHFTQSWEWGEVLEREGSKVERILLRDTGILALAQIFYKPLPFGWQYAFCPKGPVIQTPAVIQDDHVKKIYQVLLDYLHEKKCIFLRCEPEIVSDNFAIRKVKDISPSHTLILDLHKSDLLEGMKKNTRYSIHFAEKQDLAVKVEKNVEIFWELMQKTVARDRFFAHEKKHYVSVLQHPGTVQFTAYVGQMPVATAIFLGHDATFTYLFAASDYAHHKLLASYLLQWTAIQQAQQLGYKYYDFFGIAPEQKTPNSGEKYLYDPHHQYAGITRFKLGFGGVPKQAPGTFDLILDRNKYCIYKVLRFIYGIRRISQ